MPVDPAVHHQDVGHIEALDDLGTGCPRRRDNDRVEHRTAWAVDGVDAVETRIVAAERNRTRVKPRGARGRTVAGDHRLEQPPPGQTGDTGQLDLMRGERVTREPRSVHGRDPQPGPGEQHRGRRSGWPRSHDDDVVRHGRLLAQQRYVTS